MSQTFVDYHLFQLLRRFEQQHLPLDLFLSQYFRANKALGSKDRRSIATAAFGMIRWKLLLDFLLDSNPSWEKRYKIYQHFQPATLLEVQSIPLHIRVSTPQSLFEHLVQDYGEKRAIELALFSNEEAPIALRANPEKTSRTSLIESWKEEWNPRPGSYAPHSIIFPKRAPLVSFDAFKQGLFEIQDEGSQLVAEQVTLKPGDHVLDYCAGAGGKTLAYAYKSQGAGQLYLHDIRPLVLQQAKKRCRRAGIQNVQFLPPYHPQLKKLKGKMDWVLVDAPCSGTGTMRRNPDQKWRYSEEMVTRIVLQQREIFKEALSFVKPNGHIVYATCSLLSVENEQQVAHFLETLPLKLIAPLLHTLNDFDSLEMDGFFSATFSLL